VLAGEGADATALGGANAGLGMADVGRLAIFTGGAAGSMGAFGRAACWAGLSATISRETKAGLGGAGLRGAGQLKINAASKPPCSIAATAQPSHSRHAPSSRQSGLGAGPAKGATSIARFSDAVIVLPFGGCKENQRPVASVEPSPNVASHRAITVVDVLKAGILWLLYNLWFIFE
jgi:hypothetical protein